jgi:trimeric autotransporter adhesin
MASRLLRSSFLSLTVVLGLTGLGSQMTLASPGSSEPGSSESAAGGRLNAPRITQPIDENQRVTLTGNVHPLAQARFDRGEAPESTATGRIWLTLRRSTAQQHALEQYLSDLQNPHSANHHKWLSPAQFGAQFGVGDTDLASVQAWLQSHGFTIESVPEGRNAIAFSGNFGQIKSAFHSAVHQLETSGGEQHLAVLANPQIPAALAGVISGVGPLNDFHATSQARFAGTGRYNTSSHTIQPNFTLFSSSGTPYLFVDPADAATIYDTPNATLNANYKGQTYDGTGVNIGIAGDSDFNPTDVVNYRLAFLNETAASANTPTVVVDGVDPGINGDEAEALLDNEIAGGIAPKAKLYFYTSANTDLQAGLFNAIFRAIDDNTVSILNISFGQCEATLGATDNQIILEETEQAAAQGISLTVSTGDSGAAGCDADNELTAVNGFGVNGFASTPYAIGVGGTDFDVLPNSFTTYVTESVGGEPTIGTPPYYGTALSYIPEEPWNNSTQFNQNSASNFPYTSNGDTDIVAGGGGASSCATFTQSGASCAGGYAKPAFQTSLTPTDGVRDLPDVAFLAANGFYSATWVVCADGDCATTNGQFNAGATFSGYGGTSAAAPAFAGMLALVEQSQGSRLGQADNILYQLAASKYSTVFHDITTGDNSVVCTSGSPNCGSNGFLTGYDAGTGYDQASGLGSVDAAQMVSLWNSVALTGTTTAFTINNSMAPLNVVHGTNLAFHVGIAPSTATGAAAVIDDANETTGGQQNDGQIAIPLTSGAGSVNYNGLPGGTYSVYARYAGDTQDASSTSSPIQVTISPEASTTALAVNAYSGAYNAQDQNPQIPNLNSVPYGSYIYADAQILGSAEGSATQGLATGSVKLTDNTTVLTSALPISAVNQAEYESPGNATSAVFAIGAHKLVATYTGDASYNASSSAGVSFTVVQDGTTVALSPAATSIDSLASVQVQVSVNTTSVGVNPTGTVTLTANGNTLATLTNLGPGGNNGAVGLFATVTVQGSALNAGANTITATYSGDANYLGSKGTTTLTVKEAAIALSNAGPISVTAGATSGNTSQITVTPSNGFVGPVNLSCAVTTAPANATSPVTCSVPSTVNINGAVSAKTTLTVTSTSTTTGGAYVVTVTGADATTGKITASTALNVTITGGSSGGSGSFALTNGGAITIAPGATTGNTSTITVTPASGFTGQVDFSCAVTTGITSPNDPPTCTIPASVTVSGTSAATTTVTVATTASNSAALQPAAKFRVSGAALATLLLFGIPAIRRRRAALFMMLAIVFAVTAIGCGGGSTTTPPPPSGTTAGAYTVTVTGTDAATGKIVETTAVSVTVN